MIGNAHITYAIVVLAAFLGFALYRGHVVLPTKIVLSRLCCRLPLICTVATSDPVSALTRNLGFSLHRGEELYKRHAAVHHAASMGPSAKRQLCSSAPQVITTVFLSLVFLAGRQVSNCQTSSALAARSFHGSSQPRVKEMGSTSVAKTGLSNGIKWKRG